MVLWSYPFEVVHPLSKYLTRGYPFQPVRSSWTERCRRGALQKQSKTWPCAFVAEQYYRNAAGFASCYRTIRTTD